MRGHWKYIRYDVYALLFPKRWIPRFGYRRSGTMGSDSVKPFLDFEGKWAIVLALTATVGGLDFQMTEDNNGMPLYM